MGRFLYLATKNAVSMRVLVLFKQLIKKMRGEREKNVRENNNVYSTFSFCNYIYCDGY